MSKKIKLFSMEEFEKELEDFRSTSIWDFVLLQDWKSVGRKLRVSIFYPVIRFLKDIKYWFVYRFVPGHKYNVVHTGLPVGYYDVDHRMFHACFALLVFFVQKECGGVHTFFYWEDTTAKKEGITQKELNSLKKKDKDVRDLYFWYVLDRPNRPDPYENWKGNKDHSWRAAFDIEQEYDREDQEMLLRLIKIRATLWT